MLPPSRCQCSEGVLVCGVDVHCQRYLGAREARHGEEEFMEDAGYD